MMHVVVSMLLAGLLLVVLLGGLGLGLLVVVDLCERVSEESTR